MAKFENGQTVFLSDGQEVEYIAGSAGEHVVRPVFGSEDDEPSYGRPFTVYEIFAEAPVAKYDARVAELRGEVAELAEQVRVLRQEKSTFEREERERQSRLRRYGVLEVLDNLLSGKITHVVTFDYNDIKIRTIKEAASNDWGRIQALRLSGQGNGDAVVWSIEGGSSNVIPCTSLDDAKAAASKACEARFAEHRRNNRPSTDLLKFYASLGNTPPADLVELARAQSIETWTGAIARAEGEAAKYREYLEQAKAEAVPE